MPAALLGCGGDDTVNPPDAGDAGDAGGDAIALDAKVADAPADVHAPDAEAGVKSLIAVQVTPAAPTIHIGGTQAYVATANYNDGTTQDVSATATWTSSDATVATITTAGVATGVKAGSVTITATVTTGAGAPKSGSAALVVSPAALSSLAIAPSVPAPTIAAGSTIQFTATATYADATTANVTSQAMWQSSSAATATVSGLGLATGIATGSTTITATFGGQMATVTLTVSSATVVSISVTPNPGITNIGGADVQFVATASYSNGTNGVVTTTATWSSSDTTTATIGATSGLAHAVAVGSATITAALGGKTGTAVLSIGNATLTTVTVTRVAASIPAGTTDQFTATATYSNGNTQDVTSAASWQSSTPTVASISQSGLATGVTVGTTNITATFQGVTSATSGLTVTSGVLSSIAISPATQQTIPLGVMIPFVATGTFSDNSTADISALVTWNATPGGILGFNGAMATGAAAGTTTVTATLSGKTSNGTSVVVTSATLVSIAVTPSPAPLLHAGATQAFVATGTYTDGSTQPLAGLATWTSSVPAAASISPTTGLATGVAAGTTAISASAPGPTGTVTSPPVSLTVGGGTLVTITLTPSSVTLPVGQTQQFTATGVYNDGTTSDVTPLVTWDATDTSGTATADFTVSATGLVTAVSSTNALAGNAGLVRAHQGTIVGAASVKVTATVITGIAVTCAGPTSGAPADLTCIPAGLGFQVACRAVATFSDTTTSDVTTTATWSSSAPAVATPTGFANGANPPILYAVVGAGSANVIATQGGVMSGAVAIANAQAGETAAGALSVTGPLGATISIGQTTNFAATAQYTGTGPCAAAKAFDVTTLATWTSSDTSIATVSNAAGSIGQASGVAAGSSTISADFLTQTGNFALSVNAACLQSVSIDQLNPTVPADVLVPLTVKAFFSNAPTVPVQLDSSVSPGSGGAWTNAAVITTGTAWLLDTAIAVTNPVTFTIPGCGGSVSATTNVTIDTTTLPTALSITPATTTIGLGGSVDYTATASYPTYGSFDVAKFSTWAITPTGGGLGAGPAPFPSLDERVQHTGTTAGSYTVSAVYRNQTATAALTVSATHTVTSVVVSSALVGAPTGTALGGGGAPVGLPITFHATVHYSDGTTALDPTGISFASDTPGILSGFTGGVATTQVAGTTNVTASISGVTSVGLPVVVNAATLATIGLTPSPVTMPENTTEALDISGTYSNAQVFDIAALVTSSSANSTIATVSTTATGTTFSSKAITGPVVLTITKDSVTSTDTVTVSGTLCVTALAITPNPVTALPLGASQQFTATATFNDGSTVDVTTSGTITWGPATDAILQNNTGGNFTALATGSDTVTASASGMGICNGGNVANTTISASAPVTVTAATVVSITVDTTPAGLTTIPNGESRQLVVTGLLTDGTSTDVTANSTFVAGAPTILSVSPTGLVTANSVGVAAINVTYTPTNVTATPFSLTVQDCATPTVVITGLFGNIAVGQSTSYTAAATYPASVTCTGTVPERSFDATSAAAWSSSDPTVATIVSGGANAGKLTAIAAGSTNVSATYKGSGISNQLSVTPINVTLTVLTITGGAALPKGGSETITVDATWSDGGHYPAPPVSWAVADPTVLSIDGNNLLTALAVGSTTFVAQSGAITSNTLSMTVSAACISAITLSSPIGTTLPVGVPFTVAFSCTTSDGSVLPCNPTFSRSGSVSGAFFTNAPFATSGQFRISTTGAGTVTAVPASGGCPGFTTASLPFVGGTAALQSIALTPATANIPVHTNEAYTSVGTFVGGTGAGTFDLTSVAPLTSDNHTVAIENALPLDQTLPSTVAAQLTAGTAGITSAYLGVTSNTAALTVNSTKVLQALAITADENLVGGTAASATYPANSFTLQLHATGTNNDTSSTGDLTSQVTWALATPVLTGTSLTPGGLLTTGTAGGLQVVRASLGTVSATFNVNVDTGTISAVTIRSTTDTAPSTSVGNGAQALYAAIATIAGNRYWVTDNFTWNSSVPAVATIIATGSNAGTLTAVAASGTTNVTATRGPLTAGPLTVTATGATPVSVACAPASVSVTAGSTAQLRAYVTFSDTTVVEETTSGLTTWISPAPATAAFQGGPHTGIITGVASGTVSIQPTYTGAIAGGACVVTVP